MNILSPKSQLQANEPLRLELATIVGSANFHTCLSFAIADFAARSTPSAEELSGARKFMYVLLNLPFPEAPAPDFPVRRLGEHLQPQPKGK